MDWFEQLTGFQETGYDETRCKLEVNGTQLRSLVNGKSYGIGTLELTSLQSLRERVGATSVNPGRMKVSVVRGDVRQMHHLPENHGALFQVASQFNLLEMLSPSVTPEQGVTRYQYDGTQGPACAMAAGAATIYRNYFAKVGGEEGQRNGRQLDGLADLGKALGAALGQSVESLWEMKNGYAMCSLGGLKAISKFLESSRPDEVDALASKLRIGVHLDVEVTDGDGPHRPIVSQAFCSALPVAYGSIPAPHWKPLATLILQSAYEATMWAAVLNARRGASNKVFLTRLGGGVFGNGDDWIDGAMRRALRKVQEFDLDVNLVSYHSPSRAILEIEDEFR